MSTNTVIRLLLVEDNPGDADLMAERFDEVPGYRFDLIHVTRLEQALHVLRTQAIDGVILDLRLPDSSGVDTLRIIRACRDDVLYIVFSGSYSDQMRDELLAAGASDFIGKNDHPSRLLTRSILYAVERYRVQRQQWQMEKLVTALPDAVLVVTADGTVRFINSAAQRLFRRSAEDFVGELLDFSVCEGSTTEIQILRGDDMRTAEMQVVHLEWAGQPAYLAVMHDTTEQKALAEQLRQAQKMEAIGRLAGGIAHDFNNILSAIAGNINLARADVPSSHPAQESLAEIQRATDRATEIVGQILSFSRQREAESQPVDLVLIVQEACRFLKATLPANIAISTHFAERLPPILADAAQIYQVFINLGTNAAYAMRDQGGTIAITVMQEQSDDSSHDPHAYGRLRVIFSDTGHGMAEQTIQHIFEPFFTTKPLGEGTGLGLSVVHGIVSRYSGTINVNSMVGQGTTFVVSFPVALVTPVTIAKPEIRLKANSIHGSILYVDDEEQIVSLVCRMLQRRGFKVVGFQDPLKALEHFRAASDAFDVAVVDASMPHMSGPEFVQKLHELRPNLPAVMVTGYIRPEDTDMAAQVGLYDLLLKPGAFKQLPDVLQQILSAGKANAR